MKYVIALLIAALPAISSGATPAEEKITAAKLAIEKNPKSSTAYNTLALALSMRARETGDPLYYKLAEEQIVKALEVEPGNLESQRTEIWLSLGRHDFAKALDLATSLNKKVPDDLMTYAFLVDANVELGNYDDAEKASDFLLNLRPGTIPGLTRAAYLRELFGDIEGALDFMSKAFQRTSPNETEDLAWILAHVSHLQLLLNNIPAAEQAAQEALRLFPDYHYALSSLAKVRTQQGQLEEAAKLYARRYEKSPHPENLYDWAKALNDAGHVEQAQALFAKFEPASRAEMIGTDNSSKELIFYYTDIAKEPTKALEVARHEASWRHDVFTLDALAWALYSNGQYSEANREIQRAIDVGVREPQLLQHAAKIRSNAEVASR
jgi:tetratricopeptide (TPR) repeat protein